MCRRQTSTSSSRLPGLTGCRRNNACGASGLIRRTLDVLTTDLVSPVGMAGPVTRGRRGRTCRTPPDPPRSVTYRPRGRVQDCGGMSRIAVEFHRTRSSVPSLLSTTLSVTLPIATVDRNCRPHCRPRCDRTPLRWYDGQLEWPE